MLVSVHVVTDLAEVSRQIDRDPLFILRERKFDRGMKACATCRLRLLALLLRSVFNSKQAFESVCVLCDSHVAKEEVDIFSVFGEHWHYFRVEARALGIVRRLFVSDLIVCFHVFISIWFVCCFEDVFSLHPLSPKARGEDEKKALWRRRPRPSLPRAKESDRKARRAWHESLRLGRKKAVGGNARAPIKTANESKWGS